MNQPQTQDNLALRLFNISGLKIADLCRILHISSPTFYNWLHETHKPQDRFRVVLEKILAEVFEPLYKYFENNHEEVARAVKSKSPDCIYYLLLDKHYPIAKFAVDKLWELDSRPKTQWDVLAETSTEDDVIVNIDNVPFTEMDISEYEIKNGD